MKPSDAVMELSRIGFHFRLDGEKVKLKFEAGQTPDPKVVAPLLDVVKRHKDEVLYFLKSYCPRCGGVFFGTFAGVSKCMNCYQEQP